MRILKNKPLVEAIFELRWELQQVQEGIRIDPGYRLLVGRVYERLRNSYPVYEELPAARMPDEISAYFVQHRFRTAENAWPLVQLGPGIVTLNDTEGYVWEDFQGRIDELLNAWLGAYLDTTGPKTAGLLLRYIDFVSFDWRAADAFDFLKDQMKSSVQLCPKLFDNTGVRPIPAQLDLRFSFVADQPAGTVSLRFALGAKDGADGVVWETMVQTDGSNAPNDLHEIIRWVQEAHDITDDWFFKLIEGDLERRFV